MKTILIFVVVSLSILSGCAQTKSHDTIVMQAEVAGYMNGDNDSAGYDKWMNEGTTARAAAFQLGCQIKQMFPDCRTKFDDFQY